ncbi:MAG: cation transporter [Firmicutes bacterium]|nr:cation transporter [Bacillota bacterium]
MVQISIEGMTCNHCVGHVKKALLAVPGVQSAEVTLQPQQAQVQGEADPKALIAAIEEEGYAAKLA